MFLNLFHWKHRSWSIKNGIWKCHLDHDSDAWKKKLKFENWKFRNSQLYNTWKFSTRYSRFIMFKNVHTCDKLDTFQSMIHRLLKHGLFSLCTDNLSPSKIIRIDSRKYFWQKMKCKNFCQKFNLFVLLIISPCQ